VISHEKLPQSPQSIEMPRNSKTKPRLFKDLVSGSLTRKIAVLS
jgi:hypothetical protein